MAEAPNIVWLTLNSNRANNTTMAGYGRDTTPLLKWIADDSDGEWYSSLFAHSNCMRISTTVKFNGEHPSHHSIRGNWTIPAEFDTGQGLLFRQGYHSVGLSRNDNASRGFVLGCLVD